MAIDRPRGYETLSILASGWFEAMLCDCDARWLCGYDGIIVFILYTFFCIPFNAYLMVSLDENSIAMFSWSNSMRIETDAHLCPTIIY